MSGLVLITVPIGNLGDISQRAIQALETNTFFLAEDTRVFKRLLESLSINYQGKTILSFHDHNQDTVESIISKIKEGVTICLVSDAGSPIISDPAYPLIKRIRESNLDLSTIPGPTSVITALELSGLPATPFHFWGFIAKRSQEKVLFFQKIKMHYGTHIFFDSPNRVKDTVADFFEAFPDGEIVLARELTKKFESVYVLKSSDMANFSSLVVEKGEFVILFHNNTEKFSSVEHSDDLKNMVRNYLNSKPTTKTLAKIFSKILDEDTKSIYNQLTRSE